MTVYSTSKNCSLNVIFIPKQFTYLIREFQNWRDQRKENLLVIFRETSGELFLQLHFRKNFNILSKRFLLTIKDKVTNEETWRALFVLQGHTEQFKKSVVHDISVERHYSINLLVNLASLLRFKILVQTSDVRAKNFES